MVDLCWQNWAMSHPFDNLPKQLWLSSQQAARRAVIKYTDDDPFERVLAAVNMGVAAETLLMACVATIEVSFLANDPASKVALSRSGNPSGKLDPTRLRTIEWDEARRILLEKDPSLGGLQALLKGVMGTRNAAAHAALTDSEDLGTSVVSLVSIVSLLHPHLEFEEVDFWGPQIAPMVTELKDKLTSKIRQSKLAKIINAQKAFELIKERFPGKHLDAYVQTAFDRPLPTFANGWDGDHERSEEHDCPACGYTGNVFFLGFDDGEVTQGYDDQSDSEYVEVYVQFTAYGFECPVCNLSLGRDELNDFEIENAFSERVFFTGFDEKYQELAARIEPDPWELYERFK